MKTEMKTEMLLKAGMTASYEKVITEEDIHAFAEISGDFNPIHIDEEYAKQSVFKRRISHGMILGGFISNVIANKLPGPGSIYLNQTFTFEQPAFIGDTIIAFVEIISIREDKGIYMLSTICKNQNDEVLLTGEAVVMNKEV